MRHLTKAVSSVQGCLCLQLFRKSARKSHSVWVSLAEGLILIILRRSCKELCEIYSSQHCWFPFIELKSTSFGKWKMPLEFQNDSGCRGPWDALAKQDDNWIQNILGALSSLVLKSSWAFNLMNCNFYFSVICTFDEVPFCFQWIYKTSKVPE